MGKQFSTYLSWANIFDKDLFKRESEDFGLISYSQRNMGRGEYLLDDYVDSAEIHYIRYEGRSECILNLPYRMKNMLTFDCFRPGDFITVWEEETGTPKFRGIVHQVRRQRTGERRSIKVRIKNAGGYLLEDNSIYYLSQQILTNKDAYINEEEFKAIKTKLGFMVSKNLNELLVNQQASVFVKALEDFINKRLNAIRSFFRSKIALTLIPPFRIVIPDKQLQEKLINVTGSQILGAEGSIQILLQKIKCSPWAEMFIQERKTSTELVWLYNRWTDASGDMIIDEADQRENLAYNVPFCFTDKEIYQLINDSSGITDANNFNSFLGTTIKNRASALFHYVDSTHKTTYLQDGNIPLFGYRPLEVQSPFIHSEDSKEYTVKYTDWLKKSFKDNLFLENGEWTFLGLLNVGFDCKSIVFPHENYRGGVYKTESIHVYPKDISWHWGGEEQYTVIQWDRGRIPHGQDRTYLKNHLSYDTNQTSFA